MPLDLGVGPTNAKSHTSTCSYETPISVHLGHTLALFSCAKHQHEVNQYRVFAARCFRLQWKYDHVLWPDLGVVLFHSDVCLSIFIFNVKVLSIGNQFTTTHKLYSQPTKSHKVHKTSHSVKIQNKYIT